MSGELPPPRRVPLPPPTMPAPVPRAGVNGMAIGALGCSLVSVGLLWAFDIEAVAPLTVPAGAAGAALGIIAIWLICSRAPGQRGRTPALLGLILGAISLTVTAGYFFFQDFTIFGD